MPRSGNIAKDSRRRFEDRYAHHNANHQTYGIVQIQPLDGVTGNGLLLVSQTAAVLKKVNLLWKQRQVLSESSPSSATMGGDFDGRHDDKKFFTVVTIKGNGIFVDEPNSIPVTLAESPSAEMPTVDQKGFQKRLVFRIAKFLELVVDELANGICVGT